MPITRDIDLPRAATSGVPCPAGEGPRLRTDRTWSFREQCRRWTLQFSSSHERRTWRVVTARAGEGKIERTLPGGRRIFIYDAGLHGQFRKTKGPAYGPIYWLSYTDAQALWFDTHVSITPVAEPLGKVG